MVNSNFNNSILGNCGTSLPVNHKQSPLAMKKMALRDVQNDNRSFVRCHPEYSCLLGQQVMDAIGVPGTKMLTSEFPCSPPLYKSLSSNDANEQLTHAIVNLGTELGKRKNQGNSEENADCLNSKRYLTKQLDLPEQTKKLVHETPCLPSLASISTTSMVTFSRGKPEFPSFLGKPGSSLPAIDSKRPFASRSVVPCLVETGGGKWISKGGNDSSACRNS